jgi:hypothetical protein
MSTIALFDPSRSDISAYLKFYAHLSSVAKEFERVVR